MILTSLKRDIHFFVLRIRKVVIAGSKVGLEHLGFRCSVFVAYPQAFFSQTACTCSEKLGNHLRKSAKNLPQYQNPLYLYRRVLFTYYFPSVILQRNVKHFCFAFPSIIKTVSVKRRLWTADCRLRTRGKLQTECKMQTAD